MAEPERTRIIWWLELVLKLGMLTVGFLQASSLTFGKPIISVVLWPTLALGGILLLYRVWHWKDYAVSAHIWILVLFCISYAVSSLVNLQYGWYSNLRTGVWLVFLMFLLYCYRAKEPNAYGRSQYRIVAYFYLVCGAILTLSSFYFLLIGYEKTFFVESGPVYYIGFKWGRLYGAYWDPNIGALMCCISILLSLGLFRKERPIWLRVLLGINMVLEVLYIAFSDSRAGHLCICVGLAVYVWLYLWPRHKKWITILATMGMAAVMWFAVEGIQQAYNLVRITESIVMEHDRPGIPEDSGLELPGEDPFLEEHLPEEELIGREEDYTDDISNRRFDIWKSALEIFQRNPILGIGHENVLAYVEQNLPNSYLVTNDHMKFSSMHNIFFDILVGQGAVGIILFIIAGILFAIRIMKGWPKIRGQAQNGSTMYIAQFAILAMLVVAGCVMTEIVYVSSPMSSMFWLSLGRLVKQASTPIEKGESQHAESFERIGSRV